jgi:hypothetical protein
MRADTAIPHENGRHRFSAGYQSLRLLVELTPSGWLAGVYDSHADSWVWTQYVSDPVLGKRLISEIQGIDQKDITWYEYQPVPASQN